MNFDMFQNFNITLLFCRLIKPIEAVIRPKGLGLGADRAPTESSTDIKSKDEKLTLKKGAHCVLTSTSQKGQYGVVYKK